MSAVPSGNALMEISRSLDEARVSLRSMVAFFSVLQCASAAISSTVTFRLAVLSPTLVMTVMDKSCFLSI